MTRFIPFFCAVSSMFAFMYELFDHDWLYSLVCTAWLSMAAAIAALPDGDDA